MLNISVNGNAADVIKEGLLCLAENRGFTVSDNGISVEVIDGCDGYSIKGKDGQYTLKYGQKCEFFREQIASLTASEKAIYDCYVAGMSTKEVLAEKSIAESTLKYHNRNIYGKLGVSSRKELLECARAIKNEE